MGKKKKFLNEKRNAKKKKEKRNAITRFLLYMDHRQTEDQACAKHCARPAGIATIVTTATVAL